MRAELRQVRREELRVEQDEAAEPEPRHQMHQRHLGGVAHPAEHALAEEGAAQHHAIEPADQPPLLPDLDRVRVALGMQRQEQPLDLRVDPGVLPPRPRRSAAGDDAAEIGVRRHREGIGEHRPQQPPRQVEAAAQRQHAAPLRVQPVEPLASAALRHREEPGAVGPQHQLGRDLDLTAAHPPIMPEAPGASPPVEAERRPLLRDPRHDGRRAALLAANQPAGGQDARLDRRTLAALAASAATSAVVAPTRPRRALARAAPSAGSAPPGTRDRAAAGVRPGGQLRPPRPHRQPGFPGRHGPAQARRHLHRREGRQGQTVEEAYGHARLTGLSYSPCSAPRWAASTT